MTLWDDAKPQLDLSEAQAYVWFLEQRAADSAALHLPVALELSGPLDLAALNDSLNQVIARHDLLRASFIVAGGRPGQKIVPEARVTLPVIDLSHLADVERKSRVQQIVKQQAQHPFDLAQPPLLRAALLRLGPEKHVLFLVLHRLVGDRRSVRILVGDMAAFYQAFSQDTPLALPPLSCQYADLACQEKAWLQKESAQALLAHWQTQLGGDRPVLELPADRPRPAVPSARGACHVFSFPPGLLDSLRALSRRLDVGLRPILLAAFKTLLFRYTAQEDIWVGSSVDNRQSDQSEHLIGPLEKVLVFRSDLAGEHTFLALLEAVTKTLRRAYEHRGLPFFSLLQALDRDSSHAPLFQVTFDFWDGEPTSWPASDLAWRYLRLDFGVSEHDLSLLIESQPARVVGTVSYKTDLFDATSIERLVGHFQTLLAAIAADPNQALAHLPILTEAERQQMLIDWNGTQVSFAREACAHTLFEIQARHRPEAVALVCGQRQVTYGQLDQQANRLARYLQRLGVGPEVLVGLYLERSPEFVVAALATFKAGGAYVPIDPAYPQERVAFIVADAQTPILLTQERLAKGLPDHDLTVVRLDTDWNGIARYGQRPPQSGVTADNLAYVIYTSGSTGRPKGVQITHGGLSNLVHWHRHAFDISSQDRATQVAGLGFDASVWEIWPYLTAGAALYLIDQETRLDPERLRDWLLTAGKTVCFLPTPLAESVLSLDWPNQSSLRLLLTGGEKLNHYPPPDLPFELVNNYGPTENTVVTTTCRLSAQGGDVSAPPIGKPIANVQVYVLDRYLRPVPVGVVGELYIGGEGLARAYLNRPARTAQSFVPHPFSRAPGARLYKTGDLVRYRADGSLDFVGRTDFQVKVRGFRIELGEIETALSQHPQVESVVVVTRDTPDAAADKHLIAYFVPRAESTPNVADLRRYLRDKLPAYMIPSALVQLDAMPLTPHGKLDRSALPSPTRQDVRAGSPFIPPRDPVEQALASIWKRVLNLDRVGVFDNFFEWGGHSLLATRIISRLNQTFEVDVPLDVLFEGPTIADLARHVQTAQQKRVSRPPLVPVAREGNPPLSFAQQRLWFMDQLVPNSPLYNVPAVFSLTGALDVTALERCLDEIVRRHESLRTTFDKEEGQVVSPHTPFVLPVTDLRAWPQEKRQAQAQQLMHEQARVPFDLTQGPLFRAHLLRLDDQAYQLVLVIHHIVVDGWSLGVILDELGALYPAFDQGQPSPLPQLPIQYADFAQWQRRHLQGGVLKDHLAYWRARLEDDPPVLALPTDRPRPARQTFRGDRVSRPLAPSLIEALEALGGQENASLFMVLLAGFQALLYRYTGQTDIVVGIPLANRNQPEIEKLIGFFVNTLPLRLDLSDNPTFRQLTRRVRQVTLETHAHQDLPLEKIVAALDLDRHASHNSLFQTVFVTQNIPTPSLPSSGLHVNFVQELNTGTAKFDLSLIIYLLEQGPVATAEYNTDLFQEASIDRLLGHFETLLNGVVADPDRPIAALPLLTPAERGQILVQWNATQTDYPRTQCVHQLFQAQAERTPNAVAVSHQGQRLSYQALNQRANQLAHRLQKLGVGPEVVVGICLEHSPDMVVGALAVLKAGGAYLPLDPTYPLERLIFMLQDAQAPVLLTHERLAQDLAQPTMRILCLDTGWQPFAQESPENPARPVPADNLAYVIYTSGSTGQPKGVQISHRSLTNLVCWHQRAFAVSPADRASLIASPAFDASVWELWPYLTAGASLHLPDPESRLIPARLQAWLVAQAISISFLPTPLAEAGLDLDWPSPSPLRLLLTGGDKLRRYPSPSHPFQLVNNYGPTENAVVTTSGLVPPQEQTHSSPSIGQPISNTQIYVLDRHLRPVPLGVPGQLYIGGDGLARGYLNRPALTAERFVPNPFGQRPGDRLYQTGDLVRYLPDGNVEFLGRVDFQVKIRGFRIELGEIEAALGQHPDVREAVVLAREEAGGKRLAAYVVPRAGTPLSGDDLRRFLADRLPDYMLPSAFMTLETLPLTPNGKVDRRALPAPVAVDSELRETYVAPRNPVEKALAEIWAQVLNLDRVGVHDSFFALGGHSLLATQIISQAQRAFRAELVLQDFFVQPTVAAMAQTIAQSQSSLQDTRIKKIRRPDAKRLLSKLDKLSDEQISLLLSDRLAKRE